MDGQWDASSACPYTSEQVEHPNLLHSLHPWGAEGASLLAAPVGVAGSRSKAGLIVILNSTQECSDIDVGIQFFLDFSYKGLLGSFTRFNLSAGELPLPFERAIAPGRGKDLIFIADDCRNHFNGFQVSLRPLSGILPQ